MEILEIRNLHKSYGGQQILSGLDLMVPSNSIYFLIGLNGAGKTTLLKCILGLTKVDNGEITYNSISNQYGFLIEKPTFYEELSAYQNLVHHAMLIQCNHEEIKRVMRLVRLDWKNKKPIKKYSLGMLQRLGIARALMGNNNLILLDEPFNGLDPAGIHEMKELLRTLMKETGHSIILSSHLINETEQLATHYGILHKGRIASSFHECQLEDVKHCIKINNVMFVESADFKRFFVTWQKRIVLTKRNDDFVAYNAKPEDDALSNFTTALVRSGFVKEVDICADIGSLDEYFIALTGGDNQGVIYR